MQIQQDKKVVSLFLKDLPVNFIVSDIKQLKANSKFAQCKQTRVFKALKPLKLQYDQVYDDLIKKLNQLGDEITQDIRDLLDTLLLTLAPKYSIYDKFQKVTEIEKIIFSDDGTYSHQKQEFQVENNIVYLVIIRLNSLEGDKSMDYIKKVLENNQEWKDKVKIVSISFDRYTFFLAESVFKFKWKSIEHYRFLKGWDEQPKYLQVKTPFFVLINKWGQIDYLDQYPLKINLETRINELVAQEKQQVEIQEQYEQEIDTEPQELVTKQDFKELKKYVENLQISLNEAHFEGFVEVVLEKINHWKQDGSKYVHKRSKLTLSYIVDVEEEQKVTEFLENHWNKIPNNLKLIKKSKINDQEKLYQEALTKYQEIWANLGVELQYYPKVKSFAQYYHCEGKMDVHKQQTFGVSVKNITLDLLEIGKKQMVEYYDNKEYDSNCNAIRAFRNILYSLEQITTQKAKQFQSITNYKKWGEMEYTMIEHVPGQVLLFHHWAYWSGQDVQDLQYYLNLLKYNSQKWGNGFKIIALSKEQFEDAEKFMENKQEYLQYMDFYFPKEQIQIDIKSNTYIDKFGMVRTPTRYSDQEEFIEQLINEQTQIICLDEGEVEIRQNQIDKVISFISNIETVQKLVQVDKAQIIELKIQFEQDFIEKAVKSKRPKLEVFCRQKQLEVINSIQANIFQLIPEINWQIEQNVQRTISVQYPGSVCVLCQKNIINEVQQYYCPFKNEYVCVECSEFEDKAKNGSERYKYLDTLIFINGPLTDQSVLDNIDYDKIGKNIKLSKGEEGSQSHLIDCLGCYKVIIGPRYLATSSKPKRCRGVYIDYCQECFLILKNKKSQQAQTIFKQNVDLGMTEDSLFVRILYNYGNYTFF